MTTTAQPRVLPGVPSGGEFTAVGHSDNVPSLDLTTAPAGLIADADTSWMTEEKLASYNAAVRRLRDAGVEGRIAEINTYDPEDFDYVSPEGNGFHLITKGDATSIWRHDEDDLDVAHRGASEMGPLRHVHPEGDRRGR